LEALDAAVAEYEQRRAAAGVTALRDARDAACEAEEGALIALCAFDCRTAADMRAKATYLLAHHNLIDGLEQDGVTALLNRSRESSSMYDAPDSF
jgi:hypothetical protein